MARFGLAALAAAATLLAGASTAGAATVDNPGSFSASFTGGQLKVLDNSATIPLTPALPVTAAGTIDQDGNISIPAAGLTFPVFHAEPLPGTTIDVQLLSDGARGTLDPVTGATSLNVKTHVVATLAGAINDTCRAGSPAAPLTLPLTTGTSGALTGTPYNEADGTLKLVHSFALGAIDCDNDANDAFADALEPMVNELTLAGKADPVIRAYAPPAIINDPPVQGGPPPPGQPSQPQAPQQPAAQCTVPKLKALTLSKAKSALAKAGCKLGKVTKKKSSAKKGTVIATSPRSGAKVAAGTKVALTLSDGPPKKKRKKRK